MTSENAKVAYDNAIRDGRTEIAEMILLRHPDFKKEAKEVSEEEPEEDKPKKSKKNSKEE